MVTFETRPSHLAYLAAPYSHPNLAVKRARLRLVTLVAHHLLRRGCFVYSPLTHNIPIAGHGIPDGPDSWAAFDHLMVQRSDRLLVLELPGWRDSIGVAGEINCAKRVGIPVEQLPLPSDFEAEVKAEVERLMRFLEEPQQSSSRADRLSALLQSLKSFYNEREWERFHSPKNLVMTLASEMGELVELFRWLSEDESYAPQEMEAIQDEVGDLFLVLIYLADALGLDPVKAGRQKLAKMEERYPADKCRRKCLKYHAYTSAPEPATS